MSPEEKSKALEILRKAALEGGVQDGKFGVSPNRIGNQEEGKFLNALFKKYPESASVLKNELRAGMGNTKTVSDLVGAMTPEAKTSFLLNPSAYKVATAETANLNSQIANKLADAATKGAARNVLSNVVGPAVMVAEGAGIARDVLEKVNSGQSLKEAATSPENVKAATRGILGYMGANIGSELGAMVPGGVGTKAITSTVGAAGGAYAGSKLADLLTGNPVVDKIIRDRYEAAQKERMLKTKPTAASSVSLRSGD